MAGGSAAPDAGAVQMLAPVYDVAHDPHVPALEESLLPNSLR